MSSFERRPQGRNALTFEVGATDEDGHHIAEGVIVRAIVDRAKFLARLQNDGQGQPRKP